MKSFGSLVRPYIVWMAFMIVVPIALIMLYAFTTSGNQAITFQFTLEHFIRFFDPVFVRVLIRSLQVAIITTIICLLIGYPIGYTIAKLTDRRQTIVIILMTAPMWINMLVRTHAWRGILEDTGIINFLFGLVGLGPFQIINTYFAVILGMVYNFLPFMILQVYIALSKMDQSVVQASYDLGANRFQTFRRVIFPLSLSGVISGITLVFLPAVSSFVIPRFLGGGGFLMIGNLIERQFINLGSWGWGSATALILAVIMLALMFLAKKLDKDAEEVAGAVSGRLQKK